MDNSRIELSNTRIAIEHGGVTRRFAVDAASVHQFAEGRRPIHWRLEGPRGIVTIEMPRVVAMLLVADLDERTSAPRPVSKRRKEKRAR